MPDKKVPIKQNYLRRYNIVSQSPQSPHAAVVNTNFPKFLSEVSEKDFITTDTAPFKALSIYPNLSECHCREAMCRNNGNKNLRSIFEEKIKDLVKIKRKSIVSKTAVRIAILGSGRLLQTIMILNKLRGEGPIHLDLIDENYETFNFFGFTNGNQMIQEFKTCINKLGYHVEQDSTLINYNCRSIYQAFHQSKIKKGSNLSNQYLSINFHASVSEYSKKLNHKVGHPDIIADIDFSVCDYERVINPLKSTLTEGYWISVRNEATTENYKLAISMCSEDSGWFEFKRGDHIPKQFPLAKSALILDSTLEDKKNVAADVVEQETLSNSIGLVDEKITGDKQISKNSLRDLLQNYKSSFFFSRATLATCLPFLGKQ